jgi:hypothetical protein
VKHPVEVHLLESAEIVSMEDFQHEIDLEERIDAMIGRATKLLIQTKAMKQMLGQQKGSLRVVSQK